MAISLINNTSSLDSQSRLATNASKLNNTIQRLSSGLRINSSGDDAAGLAIANVFRSDISKLRQGIRNANDGVSQLQIVDGGLNTISGLLDRAGVLASQSASETFSGNRDTLQAELNKVMAEVTRQAEVIGLGGAAGTESGRFNKLTSVFIGGGSTSAQNEIGIDLTGSRVDKVGLNLSSVNIGEKTGKVTASGDISGNLTAAETLSFQYIGSNGALTTKTVSLAAGSSAANVVNSINGTTELANSGIKASLSTDGKNLVLEGSKYFAVSSNTVGTATGQVFGADYTSADIVKSSSAANFVEQTTTAVTAAGSQKFTFGGGKLGASYDLTVTFGAARTNAQAAGDVAAAVNADTTLRAAGIYAVVDDTSTATAVKFVTMENFSLNVNAPSVAGASAVAPSAAMLTAAGASSTAGGASGAKAALDSIKAAIGKLGEVQGKVGAGQNNLAQAIDLATTQITNFQAAESRIRDADIASEASDLARLTTLQQAGVAALAQANQSSQAVLSLLR